MANMLEYAQIYQAQLDKQVVQEATSGWMELNSGLVRYSGGREVKLPDIEMDGLADYDRNKGFVEGSVTLAWKTYELTQDRGRKFSFDENDVDESAFLLTAATVMGEFQRTKVVPEIDSYRYSTIAQKCMGADLAAYGYTPAAASILEALYADIEKVQEVVGENTELVITMAMSVANILSNSDKISKKFDVTDFKQGDVTTRVKSLDGIYPIRRVPGDRLKTKYVYKNGRDSGQEKGGYEPASDAQDINWIITPRNAPIAISKTDKVRIFDPETNQSARAWATDYRKYHDLWITDAKLKTCYVNIRQGKAAAGGGTGEDAGGKNTEGTKK